MEKLKKFKGLITAVVILLLIGILILLMYTQNTPSILYPEEIRDYEGQNLSSISSFRENSIRGIQYVNASNYSLTIGGLVNKTVEYTYDEVVNGFQKYQKVVTLHCIEGWSVDILWEGFRLSIILQDLDLHLDVKGFLE